MNSADKENDVCTSRTSRSLVRNGLKERVDLDGLSSAEIYKEKRKKRTPLPPRSISRTKRARAINKVNEKKLLREKQHNEDKKGEHTMTFTEASLGSSTISKEKISSGTNPVLSKVALRKINRKARLTRLGQAPLRVAAKIPNKENASERISSHAPSSSTVMTVAAAVATVGAATAVASSAAPIALVAAAASAVVASGCGGSSSSSRKQQKKNISKQNEFSHILNWEPTRKFKHSKPSTSTKPVKKTTQPVKKQKDNVSQRMYLDDDDVEEDETGNVDMEDQTGNVDEEDETGNVDMEEGTVCFKNYSAIIDAVDEEDEDGGTVCFKSRPGVSREFKSQNSKMRENETLVINDKKRHTASTLEKSSKISRKFKNSNIQATITSIQQPAHNHSKVPMHSSFITYIENKNSLEDVTMGSEPTLVLQKRRSKTTKKRAKEQYRQSQHPKQNTEDSRNSISLIHSRVQQKNDRTTSNSTKFPPPNTKNLALARFHYEFQIFFLFLKILYLTNFEFNFFYNTCKFFSITP